MLVEARESESGTGRWKENEGTMRGMLMLRRGKGREERQGRGRGKRGHAWMYG